MRPPVVKQNDIKDCGACCLSSLIGYYKGYVPLEMIRLDTNTNRNGTTAYNLVEAAKKYNFDACGSKVNDLELDNIALPCIVHLNLKSGLQHFVVLYKVDRKNVYIMDPAKGYVKKSRNDFLEEWTNVILLFIPFSSPPKLKKENTLLFLLLKLLLEDKKMFLVILILNFFVTLLSIIASYYFEIIVSLSKNNSLSFLIFVVILFAVLMIFKLFYLYWRNYLSTYLNKNIDLKLITGFIHHIFKLPLYVIKSRSSGEVLTRVTELNVVKTVFSEILSTLLLDITLVLGSSYFLWNLDARLFFILCVMSILNLIVGVVYAPVLYKSINNNIELETDFNSFLIENVEAIETIKNLFLTDNVLDKLDSKYSSYLGSSFCQEKILNNYNIIRGAIRDIGCFLITSLGVLSCLKGNSDVFSVVTFNSLLVYFYDSVDSVVSVLPKLLFVRLSLLKVNNFLSVEQEMIGDEGDFVNGDIVFQNVSFSYIVGTSLVLDKISFEVKKGAHQTIKGPSGSGKSTLCKMLNRIIDDYDGIVTIGDVCIKDYSLQTIRKNITYISQKEKIFTGTIRENIVLDKDVSVTELNKVIEVCGVKDILKNKKMRLDSLLYDSGFNLSGGERQRIILARAVIQNKPILIMDEALSELDEKTEKKIVMSLDQYLNDVTILYVSHRESDYFKNCITLEERDDTKVAFVK